MPGIPNKLYFRIGEVAKLIGVEPYVLRYWESEFPDIKPTKSKSGQRLYKHRDVETLQKIKELLYEERYTIGGAKKRIRELVRGEVHEVFAGGKEGRSAKQLEVFPTAAEDAGEPKVRLSGACTKTLLKIRRDLESILSIVHE
jgi:DNA-binding transcriptional MerR regulator